MDRCPFSVASFDDAMDFVIEMIKVGESFVGQMAALEIEPSTLDVVYLGCVFRQSLDRVPRRAVSAAVGLNRVVLLAPRFKRAPPDKSSPPIGIS